jgi:hypothetical protein
MLPECGGFKEMSHELYLEDLLWSASFYWLPPVHAAP